MMTALGGPGTSTSFTELSGFNDFVKFAIIGWFVYQYVDASIWSVGNNFRYEQFSGTLEPLFVTPVPRISILTGAALSDSIQTSISAIVLLLSASFLFGVSYALTAIAPIIVLLLMMILALYGFGFMVAGMILVFKDPSVLTQFVDTALFTVSPVNYPLQALPTQARYVAYLVPSTIAIIIIRELAITGVFELGQFLSAAAGLGATILFFWFVGIASFRYAERWTKNRGSMGGF
jgi:ABC-2 type transport system permease protein